MPSEGTLMSAENMVKTGVLMVMTITVLLELFQSSELTLWILSVGMVVVV